MTTARPTPGKPRPYQFPKFDKHVLDNGFTVISCNVPGRPIATALLFLGASASTEEAALGGVSALAAKAITEGTEKYSGADFTEASERLGAEIRGNVDWDSFEVSLQVPVNRIEGALELLAEAVRRPTFPANEVDRLRQERINQLMQIYAQPTSRVMVGLDEAVFTAQSPYSRPAAGGFDTVGGLTRDQVEEHYRHFATPGSATLVIAGDLEGFPVEKVAEKLFGAWVGDEPKRPGISNAEALKETFVRIINRPGSVQSDFAIGHVGLPRLHPDYYAVTLMNAGLGGLFNSRLNMKLREEKGYTYGARSMFSFRRDAGPFLSAASVQTAVTKDALTDALDVLRRTRDEGLTDDELKDAKDFVIGVFPLRFETPDSISNAIGSLVTFDLPGDYYDTYRAKMEATSIDQVNKAASEHLHVDRSAVVVVGDAEQIGDSIKEAGFGPVEIVDDPPPPQSR